jgi:general secretion pathway protein D
MGPLSRLRARLAFAVPASFALALVTFPGPASASTLNAVRVDGTPTGGALVSINFSGPTPAFHVIGAGTRETSVLLDNTTLAPQAPPSVAGAGPITSISIASTGSASSLALHLTAPARVSVRSGGNFIFIDVAAAPGAVNPLGAFAVPTPAPVAPVEGSITEVIELKYADISEIAGVLSANSQIATNDTFSPTQSNIGTSSLSGSFGGVSGGFNSPTTPQTFGGAVGGFGQATGLAQRVNDNIAVDRRLNAIILTGTPDIVAGLRQLIEKLDVPVASVILETQIVELSDTAARNIGLDFQPDGSGIVINGSAGGVGYTSKSLQTAQGQATLQANLYAAVTEGNARIIAKPRILAQSGQQASILTGDALPILTSVVIAGNSSTVSDQVSYVNVGVNLQILPRVASDGFVTSHIYAEVSSVTGYTQTYPQISQRTASTLATVRDGQSFVIGGLLQDSEIKSLTKLPFIGDIPLIGAFFRHVNTSHTQDNLYIVVTPHIVGRSGVTPAVEPLSIPSLLPQVGPPSSNLEPSPFNVPLSQPPQPQPQPQQQQR